MGVKLRGQQFSASFSSSGKYCATSPSAHSLTEAMDLCSSSDIRLKCSLHLYTS